MDNIVREKLIQVLKDNGMKLKFIANKLGWNYQNLVNFKNGRFSYSDSRLQQLNTYLNELSK